MPLSSRIVFIVALGGLTLLMLFASETPSHGQGHNQSYVALLPPGPKVLLLTAGAQEFSKKEIVNQATTLPPKIKIKWRLPIGAKIGKLALKATVKSLLVPDFQAIAFEAVRSLSTCSIDVTNVTDPTGVGKNMLETNGTKFPRYQRTYPRWLVKTFGPTKPFDRWCGHFMLGPFPPFDIPVFYDILTFDAGNDPVRKRFAPPGGCCRRQDDLVRQADHFPQLLPPRTHRRVHYAREHLFRVGRHQRR